LFNDTHDRDIIFAAGSDLDGPIELGFHTWDIDRFGERKILPYQVRLSLEGIPQFVWCREVAYLVVGDEAFIHYVEEDPRQKVDQRTNNYWTMCKDPSKLPQMVYLSMTSFEA
jgi:hypothetical protein